jgi:hypothetical protein
MRRIISVPKSVPKIEKLEATGLLRGSCNVNHLGASSRLESPRVTSIMHF